MIRTEKRHFGLTQRQLSNLESIRKNESISGASRVRTLYQFTAIYIGHARDLAKSGQRDAARDWYRYFNNSGVVEFLHGHSDVLGADFAKLREDFNALRNEVHPAAVANWSTEIQAVRACLEEIRGILLSDLQRNFQPENSRQNCFSFYRS